MDISTVAYQADQANEVHIKEKLIAMKTAAHPSMLWVLCTALKENGVAVRHEA